MIWIFLYFFITMGDLTIISSSCVIMDREAYSSIHSFLTVIFIGLEGMNSMKMLTQMANDIIIAKRITLVQMITQTKARGALFFTNTIFTSRNYSGNGVSWKMVS